MFYVTLRYVFRFYEKSMTKSCYRKKFVRYNLEEYKYINNVWNKYNYDSKIVEMTREICMEVQTITGWMIRASKSAYGR